MIAEKKRTFKKDTPDETQSRFYVRRWDATPKEMAEIRNYVGRKKNHRVNSSKHLIDERKAKKISEKIVR